VLKAPVCCGFLAATLMLAAHLPSPAWADRWLRSEKPSSQLTQSAPPASCSELFDLPHAALRMDRGQGQSQGMLNVQTEGKAPADPPPSKAPFPDGDAKVSGYLFSAATLQPLANVSVQLCPQEGCDQGAITTTGADGYYQFVFDSVLEVVTDTEQISGRFAPGEIHVQPDGGHFKAVFSVYFSGDDFRSKKNKHQLAYIYPSRDSWGWQGHEAGLHQSYVLHPPSDLPLPTEIEPAKTPLVLVHGHAGRDSTWLGLRPSLEALGYQAWEVYYPGKDPIVEGAAALRDAVEVILSHYAGDQVDMVTHSMGGPVARSYVSGTARYPWGSGQTPLDEYLPKVRKMLQLAPPSWGVLNLVRLSDPPWSNRCSAFIELLQILGYQNPSEPALQDLILGSPFYEELSQRRMSIAAEDALIVAGTRTPLGLCPEARHQTDLLIGASSSSLLNQGVPLGLVYRDHSEMVGQIGIRLSPRWRPGPQPPYDSDDNPYNDALQLVRVIDGFLQGDTAKVKQNLDVHIDPGDSPWVAQTWEVTVVDHTQDPPRVETRTNWPANQWNDGHYDTDFDAGGFMLRLNRHDEHYAANGLRICDAVHNTCWPLRQAGTTGIWFLDDTDWGYVLPSSGFGFPYTIMARAGGQDVELGRFEVKPMQVQLVTLSALYFPVVLGGVSPGS
jgi:pimeloyl-ACP methyl ester carboxylesterase